MTRQIVRRLSVVMAADVAGYSALMRRAEEQTLAQLLSARTVMDGLVQSYGGRIVNSVGDSVLAEFDSVVAAFQSALHIQRAIAVAAKPFPDDQQLLFRIGLQVGEVMASGADIYGDGVNVAARVQSLAKPGGVTVSAAVFDQLRDRFQIAFEELGAQLVKNIDRPVQVYGLTQQAIVAMDEAMLQPPRARARNRRMLLVVMGMTVLIIAVVGFAAIAPRWRSDPMRSASGRSDTPLTTMSIAVPSEEGGHLAAPAARALSREINAELGKRRTTLTLFPIEADLSGAGIAALRDRARRVGARYVLARSFISDAESVRVDLRLYETRTGAQVWDSESKIDEGESEASRHEAIRKAVNDLSLALSELETRRVLAAPREGQGSTDLALRGWAAFQRGPDERNLLEARELFETALKTDPNDGRALRGAILVLGNLGDLDPRYDRNRMAFEAEVLSARAVQLDSQDAAAWRMRGYTLSRLGRHEAGVQAMARAIELAPESGIQHVGMASVMNVAGQPVAALEQLDRAERLSPELEDMISVERCESHLLLGKMPEAVHDCERASALGQNIGGAQVLLAAAYASLGDSDRAAAAKAAVLRTWPRWTVRWFREGFVNPTKERVALAEPTLFVGLRKAGMPD
ncbi:MAG: hypothetical protein JSR59_09480 [Proteobacteria bacterium]|nr:hypothetical protein [Pseudomonadota bacterium]